MNEKANKELDNLIEWISHKGGWCNAPINRKQHEDRIAELNKRTKNIREALKEWLSLTLNGRGLGFELNGVSSILTGIANFISMM